VVTRTVSLSTSRYQAHDLIVSSGLVPVRITIGAPRWKLRYTLGGPIRSIAPSRELFARRGDPAFEGLYIAQLEECGIDAIFKDIQALSHEHGGRGLVLLCFEDIAELGEGSCHRRMFARWWQSKTGQRVNELGT
jgi:hypothetical protein